jgi:peptidoglycan hydrolase-like protein with peptidoglycan-binding domain
VSRKTVPPRVLLVLAAVVLVVGGASAAASLLREDPDHAGDPRASVARADPSTSSTNPGSTTTTDPRALVQPPPADLPPLPLGGLGPGAAGAEVQAFQARLAAVHFDPGPVDGRYGTGTAYAVQALQKLIGTERTGVIGEAERQALMTFRYPEPLRPDGEANRTEVDVTRQVITLYEGHQVRLVTTTSTGSGEDYCSNVPRGNPTRRVCEQANTPSGRFTFREYRDGWDPSPLGRLYNPFYFNGGIAIHGFGDVPANPASHGCARIPMHIAEYFHTLVRVGDPVYVFGGTPAKILSSTPIETTTTTAPPPPPPVPPPAPPAPPRPPSTGRSSTTTSSSTTTTTTTLPAP